MFEAVISQVKTGRVLRKQFSTRQQAEEFLSATEARLLTPRRNCPHPSMRNYRLEIEYREQPAVVAVPNRVTMRRKVAA